MWAGEQPWSREGRVTPRSSGQGQSAKERQRQVPRWEGTQVCCLDLVFTPREVDAGILSRRCGAQLWGPPSIPGKNKGQVLSQPDGLQG